MEKDSRFAVHETELMPAEMAPDDGYVLVIRASAYEEALEEIDDRGLEVEHWKKEAEAFRQTAVTLQKELAGVNRTKI